MRERPRLTPARHAQQAARDKRLAEALRENLRRRKEQARAKESEPTPERARDPGPEKG
jgi:hypothetical protein